MYSVESLLEKRSNKASIFSGCAIVCDNKNTLLSSLENLFHSRVSVPGRNAFKFRFQGTKPLLNIFKYELLRKIKCYLLTYKIVYTSLSLSLSLHTHVNL